MIGRKMENKYDYDGQCSPRHFGVGWVGQGTFSVSVFQWAKKSSGNGLKKAKSVYRIYGLIGNPDKVYQRAEEVCDFLDAGGVLEKKSERVE